MSRFLCLFTCFAITSSVAAQPPVVSQPAIAPTAANVAYGPHPRQVMDFWQAQSESPTPVVVMIHGGGWVNGDKSSYQNSVSRYLTAKISVVAINYRFVTEATEKGITPPVKWPLEDATRAVQFVRSKAKDWKLDTTRIAATGGSAGACSSLWLLYHNDLAVQAIVIPLRASHLGYFVPRYLAHKPHWIRKSCVSGSPMHAMADMRLASLHPIIAMAHFRRFSSNATNSCPGSMSIHHSRM